MLTRDYVKSILNYDPDTGEFTWKISPKFNVNIGDKAGGNHNGYCRVSIKNKKYLTHRLAWLYVYGEFPDTHLDHINGDRGDCRISNLRKANYITNGYNRARPKNNTSGIKGVVWDKSANKWKVSIGVNGNKVYIGLFEDIELAELVATEARRKYHGEFANDS
jgi:hypothetical protein